MDRTSLATCFLAVALALLVFYLVDYFAHSALVDAVVLTVIALLAVLLAEGGVGDLHLSRRRRS